MFTKTDASPRVAIITGPRTILSIGFKSRLRKVRTIDTTRIDVMVPIRVMPSRK